VTVDPVAALCAVVEPLDGDPRALANEHIGRIAPLATADERRRVVDAAVAHLVGLGPLQPYLDDQSVDEVLVNGGGDLWVERDGQLQREGLVGPDELAVVLERVLAPLGRRLDRTHPIVDARLADGSRVCAAVAPVAVDGTVLAIRRFRVATLGLSAFADPDTCDVIDALVSSRCNVIVSGGTSSGKTTMLAAVLGMLDPAERVIIVEDNAELTPPSASTVRLEARPATPDQPSAVDLDALVRTALRLRPDRLIVGEVRGDEVLALVQALNTGHDGSWSTCHANSTLDALVRLETLVLQAAPGWPLAAIRRHLFRSIDIVVQTARTGTAERRIVEIAEVERDSDIPQVRSIVRDGAVTGEITRGRA
jgi:pilus assembly protein CpaF